MRESTHSTRIRRAALILSAVLVVQALGFYNLSHGDDRPLDLPLSGFPAQLGAWHLAQEGVIESEVRNILKADDLLNRSYSNTAGRQMANLFVAFFKSQRTGQTPHSPKNCLPGSGWVPAMEDHLPISIPGEPAPHVVNRYLVQRGDEKSIVLYWYQSRDRVVASEYWAKIYVVLDALRYNRTDTALVRVVVPVQGNDVDGATSTAVDFVQHFFGPLRQHLPS